MSVQPDDVRRIAALAALDVSDTELPELARDLSRILDYVGQLARGGNATDFSYRPGPPRAPLRADRVGPVPLQNGLDQLAPDFRDGFFVVPRVEGVGDEE